MCHVPTSIFSHGGLVLSPHTALAPSPHSCTMIPHDGPAACSRTRFPQHAPRLHSHIAGSHCVPATALLPSQHSPSRSLATIPDPCLYAGHKLLPPITISLAEDAEPAGCPHCHGGHGKGAHRGLSAEVQALGWLQEGMLSPTAQPCLCRCPMPCWEGKNKSLPPSSCKISWNYTTASTKPSAWLCTGAHGHGPPHLPATPWETTHGCWGKQTSGAPHSMRAEMVRQWVSLQPSPGTQKMGRVRQGESQGMQESSR